MRELLQNTLFSIFRAALLSGGFLAKAGIDEGSVVQIATGLASFVAGLVWMWIANVNRQQELNTAVATDPKEIPTVKALRKRVKDGMAAPAMTPIDEKPKVIDERPLKK